MAFEDMDLTVTRSPRFLSYAVGWLFALIAFSCMASQKDGLNGMDSDCGEDGCGFDSYTEFQYLVAVGVLYWILSSLYMVGYLLKKRTTDFQELVTCALVNLLVFVAFCAGAAKCEDEYDKTVCDGATNAQAAVVFTFFLWLAATGSCFFIFKDWREDHYEGMPEAFSDALSAEGGKVGGMGAGFTPPPPVPTVSASTQTYGTSAQPQPGFQSGGGPPGGAPPFAAPPNADAQPFAQQAVLQADSGN